MRIYRDEATGNPTKLMMQKPADMHQHLRQDALLTLVAPMVARRFSKAIAMPNTQPPITTTDAMLQYREQIMRAAGRPFWPLMTLYLTDSLEPQEVRRALETGKLAGIKYYPRGLTTNSDMGVTDPAALWTKGTKPFQVLKVLEDGGKTLLLHAADGFASKACKIGRRTYSAGEELDPYDQELHFIAYTVHEIREAHPDLKISIEHLSTSLGVEYVRRYGGETLGCSITAQHLLLDRRDVFRSGFRPHRFWWPIIQSNEHTQVLRKFVAEGHPFVWLGSDSAPHPVEKKETDCCSGGVLMAHAGIELYAEAFEEMECLDKLERFACINGPAFFGTELPNVLITLVREDWRVEQPFFAHETMSRATDDSFQKVIPFRLGETVRWKLG